MLAPDARGAPKSGARGWEEWLRGIREITLIGAQPTSIDNLIACDERIAAMCCIDHSLTKLSIIPAELRATLGTTIFVNSIQVICPATQFLHLFEEEAAWLDDSERERAVLLQYVEEDRGKKRACFLMDSVRTKDSFVQAITALRLD
eukprot:NODE_15569_length_1043_cov_3.555677.p2 GENE.NODE_15569_length_1043_cov_3.555677~~NODE_15569_length_1043_cov_3.555677.p2  ORF type:complete len:147 (+),score=45.70 NODE_15569_length_1043_cov_3.555677:534-974(+)